MSRHGRSSVQPGATLFIVGMLTLRVQAGQAAIEEMAVAADHVPANPGFVAHPHDAASAPDGEFAELRDAAAADAEARPARPVLPRAAPTGRPLPGREPGQSDHAQLKETARAARGWLREIFPWAFSDPDDGAKGRASTADAAGGHDPTVTIGHDAIAADPLRHAPAGAAHPRATGAPDTPVQWQGSTEPRDPRRADSGNVDNPLHGLIQFVRELFEHPMTWLIVALLFLGQGAVWLLARLGAPVKRRRRRHRHRHRHRHGQR